MHQVDTWSYLHTGESQSETRRRQDAGVGGDIECSRKTWLFTSSPSARRFPSPRVSPPYWIGEKLLVGKNVAAGSLRGVAVSKRRYFSGLQLKGGISAATLYIGTENGPEARNDNTQRWGWNSRVPTYTVTGRNAKPLEEYAEICRSDFIQRTRTKGHARTPFPRAWISSMCSLLHSPNTFRVFVQSSATFRQRGRAD
jgi:hypothetical protein